MKQHQILFTGLRQLEFVEKELPELGADQVLVRTEVSLMSTGTENICFNRLFAPGTHWDNWVKYPFEPGYSTIGVIEDIGSDVKLVKIGDRVAHRRGHSSYHIVDEAGCSVVPSSVPPEYAAWSALGRITYNGARSVGFRLGDRIAVIGAGPIGQMTLRWAIACGAEETVVIDSMPTRLDIAKKGGATYTLASLVTEVKPKVEELFGGLPDVVADATGHSAVFQAALGLVKSQGRVLLIGDTGTPSEQQLTGDILTRALTVHGAHDQTTFHDRSRDSIAQLFFRLVSSGRFSMEGMNTHWFTPDQAAEAYRVANEARGETMGILFRW